MKVLLRSYDLHDPGGSTGRVTALDAAFRAAGHDVWATADAHRQEEIRAWRPDVIVAHQWATHEANGWAIELRCPFVMLVHGPGQYQAFMPVCDVVVFDDASLLEDAAASLGSDCTCVWTDAAAIVEVIVAATAAGRRPPTLSLCMTVCNEARTLEAAVASVADVVDEIVIGVDARSTDETSTIARRLATRCFEYEESSPPDFPRMRNRAMEQVTTDWAVVLDGHEWIEGADRIRQALATTAWSVEVLTLYEPDEQRVPGLSFVFPRIHRRHVRFAGAAAHEEVSTPQRHRVTRRDIKVWHERKPGSAAAQRSAEKSGAELDVLRAAWVERGDRRALFYLANGLRESGRFADAIAAYDEYLRAPNFAEEAWQALLFLGRCHAALGAHQLARRVFERAINLSPERAEASVGLGYSLLNDGQASQAAAWFRMAAALPEPDDCRLFVEVPVYRWGAWHGLALALDRVGDAAGALAAERRARAGGAGPWADVNIGMWAAQAAAPEAPSPPPQLRAPARREPTRAIANREPATTEELVP
jgi:glycosyltransferase involved in cell wall biosynthesis